MPLASAARGAPEPDAADFTVSASLPPMVAGGLAGEMELSVPYLYPKPGELAPTRYLRDSRTEPVFIVRMRWWGDNGPGTVFKPGLLRGRDRDGERARRAKMSKATCALFPVRCALDGLLTYLSDMGSISLDILVHEGGPKGARRVGRCAIPVGSWSGQADAGGGSRGSGVVADGYFPVLSLDGNRYAGDLRVCLRACLGDGSKLRSVLAAADKMVGEKTTVGAEAREIIEALDGGTRLPARLERSELASMATRLRSEEEAEEPREAGLGSGLGPRKVGKVQGSGLPARASFDSADLTDGSSSGGPPPAAAATGVRPLRGSAPLSSFQLNEALAGFDASDTLPVWPTPKGSLYRPPETRGEAAPTPLSDQQKAKARGGPHARSFGAAASATARRKPTTSSPDKLVGFSGRGQSSPPTRVGAALTGKTRMASMIGGAPPGRTLGRAAPREFGSSVSPERQAPDPTRSASKTKPLPGNGGGGSRRRDRAGAEAPPSPRHSAPPNGRAAVAAAAPASEPLGENGYLSRLLDRGKDLREKMTIAAAASKGEAQPRSPTPLSSSRASLSTPAADHFAGLAPQPGLFSGALLDSSLRDDIEGIFDTLSDGDPTAGIDEAGMLVRDPETRGDEGRVVDLLLAAAGPPPSSLAFPALAAVERKRADSLARVRFLRIRLSRLVMFGSMTSSPEGHGWQLRFRLPAFATPPGRGSAGGGGRRTAVARGADVGGSGGTARNARVVSVAVPPRVSASTLGKSKTAMRRGRSTNRTSGTATSVLRVRRGFGACDLVVGETSLLEEVVCAVDVDDACVTHWMDTAVEFLLVDGKTDGTPRARPSGQLKNHPHLQTQQRHRQSSTVGPGDRVAAVATLPLRDLVLSAELGVAATLDLVEVSDFWAAEDARAAAAGRTGRGGRPLRNPYRSGPSVGGGARPLVLGDRAIGALAVALELVPGEPDVSPEHSRPEVERWSNGSRQEGDASLPSSPGASVTSGWESSTGRRGGDAPAIDDSTRVAESGLSPSAKLRESRRQYPRESGSDAEPPAPLTACSSPSLDQSMKDASGTVDNGLLNTDCAVLLRIDDLVLAPSIGLEVGRVRVAYSFTQQVEGYTPTVTHRSVTGSEKQQQATLFAFGHEEVFPAPADSSTWRLSSATSRVFEVWGSSAERLAGSGGGDHAEALLGLAKVSLGPFAAFDLPERGSERAAGAETNSVDSRLAVGADGPVPVSDPFSGRAVGEVRMFLALGASSRIAALSSGSRATGGAVPASAGQEEVGGETGGTADRPGGDADETGTTMSRKGDKEEHEGEVEGRSDRIGVENEGGGDAEEFAGAPLTHQESPALDDSAAELSMLLNPGRARRVEAEGGRSSGGFAGLVRHVLEITAVGELPLPLDDGIFGQEHEDEPVGCAIEYMLPAGQTLVTAAGQRHELWWDADSAVLNSRARHTVKVPDQSLNGLLDCMFGREDVVFSLFWSAGGAGAQQGSPGGSDGEAEGTGLGKQRRSPLGKVVLRRSDMLSLVQRTSSRVVLRLPIEPARTEGTDKRAALPAPETLPLSICYRREPSAVARRKSRDRRGLIEDFAGAPVDGRAEEGGSENPHQYPGVLPRVGSDAGRSAGNAISPSAAVGLGAEQEKGENGETSWGGQGHLEHGGPPTSPREGVGTSRGSGGELRPSEGGCSDSLESGSDSLVVRSSGTEHLLPAHTKLCVRVESVVLTTCAGGSGEVAGIEEEVLVWVGFAFRGPDTGGRAEREKGGVFLWKPAAEQARRREIHWSPPVLTRRNSERDRVAPLEWSIELPVTIDAAFVEYVRTQSLELHVWRGSREDWPAGGAACGVAKVQLSFLLTTLGGVGGDHRGLDSNDDSDPCRAGATKEDEAAQVRAPSVVASPGEVRGVASARRRPPQEVSFREEVEVLGGHGSWPTGSGGPHDSDRFTSRGDGEEIAPITRNPDLALQNAPADALCSKGAREEARSASPQPHKSQPSGAAAEKQLAQSSRGERGLDVYVERAMRLLAVSADVSGGPASEGGVATPERPPLSTYVTFRWEEEGRPPLRSPLLPGPARSTATGATGGGDKMEEWQGTLTADGDIMTRIVENSSNPAFDHAAQLRLVDPSAWARVCGPSAALVFRVWRREHCNWWDAPRPPGTGAAGPSLAPVIEERVTAALGSQFGDKLIGSAVVGLEVLRGAIDSQEGGLRVIDGWYHVLDDLRRPQGQIKVSRSINSPPSKCRYTSQTPQAGPAPPVLPPALALTLPSLSLSPPTQGASTPATCTPSSASSGSITRRLGPCHDGFRHAAGVHALLDSLPAEFRSTQPRQLTQTPPSSSVMPTGGALELPSPSEEPGTAAPLGSWHSAGRYGGEASSRMPELRRMLSSLDRVDRRLFALASRGDSDDGGDGDRDDAGFGDADDAGCDRGGPTSDDRDGEPTEVPTAAGQPQGMTAIAATGVVRAGAGRAKTSREAAVSRLQRAWRARLSKQREAAEAKAEREAFSLRQKRREEAAATIQLAYRRAQARHRAKGAAEERRRWEGRERRRAAACAVLERSWRAFQARRAEDTARAAVLVQAVWRGISARAAVARRFEASRARSRTAAAAANVTRAARQGPSSRQASIDTGHPLGAGMATTPRSLPLARPSTFYNQLSQDPRRSHRLQLPEAHVAAAPALPPSQLELRAGMQGVAQAGGRSLARSGGAVRPPRFADKETERIARIMKGNLQQHWASARSSSSSDDVDL
ncbi:unnamed protein product [Scytosiphon promiscuus]